MKSPLEFTHKNNSDPAAVWGKILWSDETKIELILATNSKLYVQSTSSSAHTSEKQHTYSEV